MHNEWASNSGGAKNFELGGAELLCPDKLKSQIDTILKNPNNICVYENININFLILK